MKKEYIKPSTEIFDVELQRVIATSPIVISDDEADSGYTHGGDADKRSSWGSLW
jgi:2-keto-4-pentenoate hydratase